MGNPVYLQRRKDEVQDQLIAILTSSYIAKNAGLYNASLKAKLIGSP